MNKIKNITNKMHMTPGVMQSILLLLISFNLVSCSTYPSKFKCGDAKGLGCTMLAEVDKQIDSGKIAEVYQDKAKCKGKNCSSIESQDHLVLKHKESAKYLSEQEINDSDDIDSILDDDNNLYF